MGKLNKLNVKIGNDIQETNYPFQLIETIVYKESIEDVFPKLTIQSNTASYGLSFGLYGSEYFILDYKIKNNNNKTIWSINNKKFRLMNTNYGNLPGEKVDEIGMYYLHCISEIEYKLLHNNFDINYNIKNKNIKDIINKIFSEIKEDIIIEDTIKLDDGRKNLFIPKYKNILTFLDYMTKYAINYNKKGGFLFFENKNNIFFTSLDYLFSKYIEDYYLHITYTVPEIQVYNVRMSPAFKYQYSLLSHNQELFGLNYKNGKIISLEKNIEDDEYKLKENNKIIKNIKHNIINISKKYQIYENEPKKKIKFMVPYTSENTIKGFSDSLFYYKMFDNFVEIDFTVNENVINRSLNFLKVGNFINLKFYGRKPDGSNSYLIKDKSGIYFIHSLQAIIELREEDVKTSFIIKLAKFGNNSNNLNLLNTAGNNFNLSLGL